MPVTRMSRRGLGGFDGGHLGRCRSTASPTLFRSLPPGPPRPKPAACNRCGMSGHRLENCPLERRFLARLVGASTPCPPCRNLCAALQVLITML